ncbi:hypothetical protein JKF63_02805 [Porcisia hertigi]|uniref:Isochorismatase-like domain-containing protein n=1 Tax=Porcisia hertigi TaxID=2761500 RepID=A0A836HVX8_9TRYP|nr:hypothetical protein JKF63_02805 [Porcisia hertigi]
MSLTPLIASQSHLLRSFDSCRTIFMCCDIQEKLRQRIPNFQDAVYVSNWMASIHSILTSKHVTFVATEQYPKGVGHLVKDICLPEGTPVFEKVQPSMLLPEVLPYLYGDADRGILPVEQAVLWGHETHVCVLQTADELLCRNVRVAVLVDGCAAQLPIDHDVAIREMASWRNLTLTTSVSASLQLLRSDKSRMKQLMGLISQKNLGNSQSSGVVAGEHKPDDS